MFNSELVKKIAALEWQLEKVEMRSNYQADIIAELLEKLGYEAEFQTQPPPVRDWTITKKEEGK